MAHQERVNIAVFIDFDNIEIGVKTTLGEHFDIGIILEALKERGEVVTKIAYADWTRAGEYSRNLTQHAIRLVQRNLTPGGDKNGADINLALDALEMAFTHPHINAYVIVGGDSDFLSLVEKLKQYDKKVFVVGGRAFTSIILQRNCHEFIAYENLVRRPSSRGGRPSASTASSPIAQAFPIVRRALKILADREVSPQTGLLKSTLLQLDSTFSERSYGASSFLDFAEKLSQAGLVSLKHSGRSVMVELNPGFPTDEGEAMAARPRPVDGDEMSVDRVEVSADTPVSSLPQAGSVQPPPEPMPQLGDNAEGVKVAGELLGNATAARWPMYLRNAKQILRAGNFDERRYGFGGLLDLLRACQRESLIRLERDRRGGLRVFQGQALVRPAAATRPALTDASEPNGNIAEESVLIVQVDGLEIDQSDIDIIDMQPLTVVDTTAELLGRAKPKRPRARVTPHAEPVSAPAPSRGARKSPARKPAPKSGGRTRSKKSSSENPGNE